MDVDADCTYTDFVQYDVISLSHAVIYTVVVIMTTIILNLRYYKFWGHIHIV